MLMLLSTAVAAGCGGEDEETSTAPAAAQTKEEFISQADEICARGDQEIEQAGQALGQGRPAPEELEQFSTETLIPNIQGQIDDLRALQPPPELEPQVTEFLDTAQEELDQLEQDPSKLGPEAFAGAGKQAEEIGFQNCAR